MVRIHVRPMARGLAVATASLGALAQVGCAAEVDGIDLGDSEDALTSAAGTGVVRLQGFSFGYESTSRGDELVRTGERLQAELSFDELVYVFDYADRDGLTPSSVKVTAKVEWLDASGAVRSTASFPVSWGTTGTARVGSTRSFTVPKKAAAFSIDFQVTSGGKTFLVGDRIQVPHTFPIFGYDLPNKVALFDNGPAVGQYSEAARYELDEKDRTFRRVWTFDWDQAVDTDRQGDVQPLDNGNTLVNWGGAGFLTEVTEDREVVWGLSAVNRFFGFSHQYDRIGGRVE